MKSKERLSILPMLFPRKLLLLCDSIENLIDFSVIVYINFFKVDPLRARDLYLILSA